MSNSGEFCWNELATSNPEVAKEFYGKMFGWEFIEYNMGETTYTMIKSKEKEFGGIWQIPVEQKDKIPPHWIGYILVENLADAVSKAESLGASIKVPLKTVENAGRFAVITDPTGATIALWESLSHCQN